MSTRWVFASRIVIVALTGMPLGAGASESALDSLLRPPQYDDPSISPDGTYLALSYRLEDRSVLTVVDRATMKVTAGINPGKDRFVEGVSWANDNRLFITTSMRSGSIEQPWLMATTFAVDANGRNRSSFEAEIIDLLPQDSEHVLIRQCTKRVGFGCMTEVRRMPIDFRGNGERLALGPHPNSAFMADAQGRVRFAWGWDDDDRQWLSQMEGDGKQATWKTINDEAQSGVEIIPLGTSRDSRLAYLRSERLDGPDAIETFEFATGARETIYRHDRVDPVWTIWSADGVEPIGTTLNTGLPSMVFWNEAHPDAVFLREIEKAFPGELAQVEGFTRNGEQALVTVTSDREPGRFYLIERSSGKVVLLNKRRPWLDSSRLGRTRPAEITARDGVALSGFVTLPPGQAERNLPMVVLPHGGPYKIYDTWGFDEDVQILAAHSYAVLRVNFRGSGGYGRAFVESGYREWGAKMQDDLTDATRWATSTGLADPARVCIYGGSYGGYAALMGVVREPDLYRCAAASAAPTDLDIMWRWGDIQRSRSGRAYLERAIGRDPAELAKRSPTRRAGEIKSALMIVHGEHDYRVSPQHGEAMRNALDAAGKDYIGFFPRNETHGVFGAENRKIYYRQLLEFLRTSLAPPAGAATPTRAADDSSAPSSAQTEPQKR